MIETMTPPIPASTQVLVIGGGPVGLSLAGDLGLRGISCLLIEQSDGRIVQPKMDMVGVRTMEFCRRWGVSDAVAAMVGRDQNGAVQAISSSAGRIR